MNDRRVGRVAGCVVVTAAMVAALAGQATACDGEQHKKRGVSGGSEPSVIPVNNGWEETSTYRAVMETAEGKAVVVIENGEVVDATLNGEPIADDRIIIGEKSVRVLGDSGGMVVAIPPAMDQRRGMSGRSTRILLDQELDDMPEEVQELLREVREEVERLDGVARRIEKRFGDVQEMLAERGRALSEEMVAELQREAEGAAEELGGINDELMAWVEQIDVEGLSSALENAARRMAEEIEVRRLVERNTQQQQAPLAPDRPVVGVQIATANPDTVPGLEDQDFEGAVRIEEVFEGAPAEGTLQPGDIVVAVDGEAFSTIDRFVRLVADREAGDQVRFTVFRDGSRLDLSMSTQGADRLAAMRARQQEMQQRLTPRQGQQWRADPDFEFDEEVFRLIAPDGVNEQAGRLDELEGRMERIESLLERLVEQQSDQRDR